ncbi:MAG: HEAT repeat domain-containing protein [Candidatus Micrarchaeota archaeon]
MPRTIKKAKIVQDVPSAGERTKPEWILLRRQIYDSRGDAEKTSFLMDTLRDEGSRDFVTAFAVLWALPKEIPAEHAAEVVAASSNLIRNPQEHYPMRKIAIDKLIDVGLARPDEALSEILALTRDANPVVSVDTLRALSALGELYSDRVIPELGKLARDPLYGNSATVTRSMGALGARHCDQAMAEIESLAGAESMNVRLTAIKALEVLGGFHPDAAAPLLGKLVQDEHRFVQENAQDALEAIDARKSGVASPEPAEEAGDSGVLVLDDAGKKAFMGRLIDFREPALAHPDPALVQRRLDLCAGIGQELIENHPELVGWVIIGSTSKGYMDKVSDLEYGVVGAGVTVLSRFPEIIQHRSELPLCETTFIKGHNVDTASIESVLPENADILFKGLFFGDRERFEDAHAKALNLLTPDGWDKLRNSIIRDETNLWKARRFGLSDEELEDVITARMILYTPPDLEAMKEDLRKRKTSRAATSRAA